MCFYFKSLINKRLFKFNKILSFKCIFKIIYITLFILSYFFYYLSLEKCYKGFDICGQKMNWIINKLTEAIISYIILALLFELIILKIISKYHLIHTLFAYIFFIDIVMG